ncbi:type II toxin-antitoxin system RelE/ParE family toxin [Pleomorphovibrio marinus]|uniref:type II toxin-antitoxin system RelE/ParE family toxin n=1 Tax=Pleomorphovibrio marinus TaxID=2164132 RepID=UPI000E0B125E|nr:type II toxin-antitoxin system RelE/ParE family toxin [Pleomorphovibrio marinus]
MSYRIKLLPEARLDIKEIMEWYNEEKLGLGRRFYESLKSRLVYIRKYPLHCQVSYRDVRNILVDSFPYQVHYRIEEPDRLIVVFAVTHTSRDPRVWKNKR